VVLEYSQCTGGVYFEAQDRCLELEMSSLMSWLRAFDQAYCVVGLLVRQCKATMKQGLQRVLCLREAITLGRSSRDLSSKVEVNVEAKVEAELAWKTCR